MERRFYRDNLYSAVRITHIHYGKVERGWSYGDDRHNLLEFKYCAVGALRMWIDGESYDLQSGDAVIVKPGTYHRTEPVEGTTEFFVFHFDVETEQVHAAFQMMDSPLLRPATIDGELISISAWVDRFVLEFGDVLAGEMKPAQDSASYKVGGIQQALMMLRAQSRLLEFIGVLGQSIVSEAERTATIRVHPTQMNLAREAAYHMEKNIPAEMRIGELADYLGVHRSYLSDCFKQVYGMSPRQYLNNLRIRQAKLLLQDTPYTIEEIAQRLQFSSSAHFCRFFRQIVGLTPGRYRNR